MLTTVERAEVELELRRRASEFDGVDLMSFIPMVSPRYESPRHLEPLIRELERIPEEQVFACVSVPPRHSKSETLLHYFALLLKRNPHMRIAYASYAQSFSETQALKAHRYALRAGVKQNPRMRNRTDWQTMDGGGIFATSVDGGFTGRGADLIVIDDPFSNPQQANSPVYRGKVWNWFEEVVETRMEPGASVVVLMTRWHADDLTGRIQKLRPEYTTIRIPALADGMDALGKTTAADPINRVEGEALWPNRYPVAVLEDMKDKKPFTFASLYQGLPRPKEDVVFSDPHHYTVLPTDGGRTIIGVDTAYTKSSRANYTAVTIWLATAKGWYLRYAEKWQEASPVTLRRLQNLQRRYGGILAVEGNGPQKAIVDLLIEKGLRVHSVQRVADKFTQAQALAEAWANGGILLPDPLEVPTPWYDTLVDDFTNFTGINDAEDDYVDSAVNAYTLAADTMPDAGATLAALKAVVRRR